MILKILRFIVSAYDKGWSESKALLRPIFTDRAFRFVLVNLLRLVLYVGSGLIFVSVWGWPLLLGNACAYLVGFFVSYFSFSLWIFKAEGDHADMIVKFAFVQLAGLGLNTVIVSVVTNMGAPYPLSMCVAFLLVPAFVYRACKHWVFRKKKKGSAEE